MKIDSIEIPVAQVNVDGHLIVKFDIFKGIIVFSGMVVDFAKDDDAVTGRVRRAQGGAPDGHDREASVVVGIGSSGDFITVTKAVVVAVAIERVGVVGIDFLSVG